MFDEEFESDVRDAARVLHLSKATKCDGARDKREFIMPPIYFPINSSLLTLLHHLKHSQNLLIDNSFLFRHHSGLIVYHDTSNKADQFSNIILIPNVLHV